MSDTQQFVFKTKCPIWYMAFTGCFIVLTFIIGSLAAKGEKPYFSLMYNIPILAMAFLLFFNLFFTTYRVTSEQFTIKPGLARAINIPIDDITEIKQLPSKRPTKLVLRYQSTQKTGFYSLTPRQPSELLEAIRKFNPAVKVI